MMILPVHLEAKFEGFGTEEFFEGHPGSEWEEYYNKASVLCYD